MYVCIYVYICKFLITRIVTIGLCVSYSFLYSTDTMRISKTTDFIICKNILSQ